jgi:hypothetical protein
MNSDTLVNRGVCFNARKAEKFSTDFDQPLQIITNLGGYSLLTSLPDHLVKLWSVLITLDKDNNPIHYSDVITWPPDVRKFLNDDNSEQYMKLLYFPNRKKNADGKIWTADSFQSDSLSSAKISNS